jgi:hypothetical protein
VRPEGRSRVEDRSLTHHAVYHQSQTTATLLTSLPATIEQDVWDTTSSSYDASFD